MKTRVRTSKKMEAAEAANNMPIKPKVRATPDPESEIREQDQIAITRATSRRHKVKPAHEANGNSQQGE